MNPPPEIAKVAAPEPTLKVDGVIPVTAGAGLFTAYDTAEELPPPGTGFLTTTLKLPTVASSPADNATLIWVELT